MSQGVTINGAYYSHASVEIRAHDKLYTRVKEIKYSHTLDPGVAMGTGAQAVLRTLGKYECDGSMAMYRDHADDLIADLGDGFMAVEFTIVVAYRSTIDLPLVVDTLNKVRIKKDDNGSSEGNDPSVTSFDLLPMSIYKNGKLPFPGFVKG